MYSGVKHMNNNNYIDVETGEIYKDAEEALERHQSIKQDKLEKKNSNFIQLSKNVGTNVINVAVAENATAVQILMFFLDNMDNQNAIMVSQSLLVKLLNKSRTTIFRALNYLSDNGIIAVGKVGTANVYIVNPEVAWQRSYKEREFVNFKGNILLAKSENKELFEKFNKIKYTSVKVTAENEA